MRRKLFSNTNGNNRRKLFSNNSDKRRKLFSTDDVNLGLPEVADGADSSRVVPDPKAEQFKDVKCMDCGYVYPYEGSALSLICPNCGSDRFEFVSNISSEDELKSSKSAIEDAIENPVNKAFSDTRRKLFSNEDVGNNPVPYNASGSVTSLNPGPEKVEKIYECPDCGAKFESNEQYVDYATCPVCGGDRSRLADGCDDDDEFADYKGDKLDEFLTKYKGRSVDVNAIEAELKQNKLYDFVGGANGLIESGYATGNEDGTEVMFSDIADLQRKMFSKLVISVTKEFDIEPIPDRESVINSLAGRLPEKSIMILKRSQMTPEAVNFSDKSYLKDSGISDDLRIEYGGSSLALKDFMKLLSEEYPDAPENIIDLLESDKTIKVSGSKVLVNK